MTDPQSAGSTGHGPVLGESTEGLLSMANGRKVWGDIDEANGPRLGECWSGGLWAGLIAKAIYMGTYGSQSRSVSWDRVTRTASRGVLTPNKVIDPSRFLVKGQYSKQTNCVSDAIARPDWCRMDFQCFKMHARRHFMCFFAGPNVGFHSNGRIAQSAVRMLVGDAPVLFRYMYSDF